MRIAFISTILQFPWGGADSLWTRVAEVAAQRGDSLFLALSAHTAQHERIHALRTGGATLHVRDRHSMVPSGREQLRNSLRRLAGHRSLLPALAEFRPQVIVLCQGGTYDFLVEPLLLAYLGQSKIPCIAICQANGDHTVLNDRDRHTARAFLAQARAVVFVSEHNLRLAERQLAERLPNAHVIQNPLIRTVAAQPWPNGQIARFAVVGRVQCFDKGGDVLLSAIARAIGGTSGWELTFFGRGPDVTYLQVLARHCGIDQQVRFAGFIDDISAVWRNHSLLLLPSRIEGCSLAMLEALASGRPVLATRVGGADEWIADGVNGYLCSAAEETTLAHALARAWADRARWPQLGAAAAGQIRQLMDPAPERKVLALLPRP